MENKFYQTEIFIRVILYREHHMVKELIDGNQVKSIKVSLLKDWDKILEFWKIYVEMFIKEILSINKQ
jgi:hypothetical protein